MNDELRQLLKSVAQGEIRDVERTREILRDANAAYNRVRRQQQEDTSLYLRAQDAFVHGWTVVEAAPGGSPESHRPAGGSDPRSRQS
jgi:hypothetical protein